MAQQQEKTVNEIYRQTQEEFKNIRNNCKRNADPILQRNEKYVTTYPLTYILIYTYIQSTIPKPKIETTNYYSIITTHDKETRPQKKVITPKSSLIMTDYPQNNASTLPHSHKRKLTEQYEKKAHNYKDKCSIKQVNSSAKIDVIGNILSGNCPEPQMKPIVKVAPNRGEPSQEYIKFNQKANNINNKRKTKNPNYLYSQDKLNTFERIIGNDNNNKSYIYEKPLGKKNISHQQSSVGGLLKYENTPKGYDIELNKPTQSKYRDIVSSINNNKHNKVFNKPANRLFNENKQTNHVQLI